MFELRCDPVMGRQVLISEERALRPNDFSGRETANDTNACEVACPFCVGHEADTPEALLEVTAETGEWQVRVVPNKYPAVSLAAGQAEGSPFGAHEVIIESPRHTRDITELSVEEFARVLRVYRERLRDWSTDERIRYCSIFKNVGNPAGASLAHVHSQLIALPEVPPLVVAELAGAKQYQEQHGSNLFSQIIAQELDHRSRLVIESDHFVAFCPYAARQPFETWILPRAQESSFQQLTDADSVELSQLLIKLIAALQTQLSPLSYNLILHTAPFSNETADYGYYHWHFELVPRSAKLAGFEWGTGMHINSLSPERAADLLRVASCQYSVASIR